MPESVAEVQLLIQDGTVLIGDRGGRENKLLVLPADHNDRFLDGPACRRVAVVDFDPGTGAALPPPAAFTPYLRGPTTRGRFRFDGEATSAATIAVNAFGTVFSTIRMFEGPDALGRPVTWAFPGEQLLVVPRAGEWANAFYDRDTRSLQFYWFAGQDGRRVYTALSRDIVSHECGHALLDAVVPSLYDSATPQAIAIHEGVADLVAVLMALDSDRLRTAVLARSDNSLDGANAFNGIAEEFGLAKADAGGVQRRALRELDNTSTLKDLAGARPHELSTVLSGIFYDSLAAIYASRLEAEVAVVRPDGSRPSREAAANKALGTAHLVGRRLLLRGIDYLPPGELSFADVGRASLAAERARRPEEQVTAVHRAQQRDFALRFKQRLVVASVRALDSPRPRELDVPGEQVPQLHDSDWAAYAYVTAHRDRLGIPAGLPFTVLPRVDATKVTGSQVEGIAPTQRELILKVAWNHLEKVTRNSLGVQQRLVPTGVTVALRWHDGRCLALVRSDVNGRVQRRSRDVLLLRLADEGLIDHGSGVRLDVTGGVATLSSTHRLLHLAGWEG
ncbi:hypothetical protein BH10ACT10_BH10ACT10_23720 [soil metagenome]